MNFAEEKKHNTNPIYVGSSVIGMRYNEGLVIACDTRLNYGSLSKFFDVSRIQRINANTFLSSAGEYSDYQEVTRILRETALDDVLDTRSFLGPKEITNYLSSMHYYKRNKMNPYWNSTVIGGINWDGTPVLYSIDQFGTLLTGDWMLVGMAQYFCNSIIDPLFPDDYRQLTKQRAIDMIEQCFKVLFYRDTRAGNNIKFAFMELRDGTPVYDEYEKILQTEWNYKHFLTQANENIYLEN
jgi:20S proteasome subunit beta 7